MADGPMAAEDASLAAAEAQLPAYLATDTEDSENHEDYIPTIPVRRVAHDDEAGTSRARVLAPAARSHSLTRLLPYFRHSQTSSAVMPRSSVSTMIYIIGYWLSKPVSRRPRHLCSRR